MQKTLGINLFLLIFVYTDKKSKVFIQKICLMLVIMLMLILIYNKNEKSKKVATSQGFSQR